MSVHSNAKSEEYQKRLNVDTAGIDGRKMLLPEDILTKKFVRKSAEVIVHQATSG